jgi:hypothetical protein
MTLKTEARLSLGTIQSLHVVSLPFEFSLVATVLGKAQAASAGYRRFELVAQIAVLSREISEARFRIGSADDGGHQGERASVKAGDQLRDLPDVHPT